MGPTLPCGVIPTCFWKAMTALRVGVSKRPLTLSPALRLAFSWRCRTRTASPTRIRRQRNDQPEPCRVADRAVREETSRGLEYLDSILRVGPEDPVCDDEDAVRPEQALDRCDVGAAVAEALSREACRERGNARRRSGQQQKREGDRDESANGPRHGHRVAGGMPCTSGQSSSAATTITDGRVRARRTLQRMQRLTDALELLDGPLDDPATLAGNLRDLGRVNRWLGGVDLSATRDRCAGGAPERPVAARRGDGRGGYPAGADRAGKGARPAAPGRRPRQPPRGPRGGRDRDARSGDDRWARAARRRRALAPLSRPVVRRRPRVARPPSPGPGGGRRPARARWRVSPGSAWSSTTSIAPGWDCSERG